MRAAWGVVAAMVLVARVEANACSVLACLDVTLPRGGVEVPANLGGLVFVPRYGIAGLPELLDARVLDATTGATITGTLETWSAHDQSTLVRFGAPLEIGHRYTIRGVGCDRPDRAISLTAGPRVPLPESLGVATVDPPARGEGVRLTYTDAMCGPIVYSRVRAQVRLAIDPSIQPWIGAIDVALEIDGVTEPLPLGQIPQYQVSYDYARSPDRELGWSVERPCGSGSETVEVAFVAGIPGVDRVWRTEPVSVLLDCGPAALDGGTIDGSRPGAPGEDAGPPQLEEAPPSCATGAPTSLLAFTLIALLSRPRGSRAAGLAGTPRTRR